MPSRDRPAPAVAHRLAVLAAGASTAPPHSAPPSRWAPGDADAGSRAHPVAPPAPAPQDRVRAAAAGETAVSASTHAGGSRAGTDVRPGRDGAAGPRWTPRPAEPSAGAATPPTLAGLGSPDTASPSPAATLRALADVAARADRGQGRDVPGPGDGRQARLRVRWAVAPRAAAVAALAVALLAGGVVLRASTTPRADPVTVPRPSATAVTAGSAQPAAAASSPSPDADAPPAVGATATAVLHVVGAVAAPGVVTLPADARAADAVAAAGGPTADADLSALNLARVVVDGEQLHVPRVGEAPPAPAAAPPAPPAGTGPGDDRLDLNTADAAALDALPGVGPVLAQRILERRAEAPFASVDELDEVSGIGPAVLERLRPLVRV